MRTLCAAACVSRAWCAGAASERLWRAPRLDEALAQTLDEETLTLLLAARGRHIEELDLTGCARGALTAQHVTVALTAAPAPRLRALRVAGLFAGRLPDADLVSDSDSDGGGGRDPVVSRLAAALPEGAVLDAVRGVRCGGCLPTDFMYVFRDCSCLCAPQQLRCEACGLYGCDDCVSRFTRGLPPSDFDECEHLCHACWRPLGTRVHECARCELTGLCDGCVMPGRSNAEALCNTCAAAEPGGNETSE